MDMEAHLLASFSEPDALRQATEALLLQGIIELRPLPPRPSPTSGVQVSTGETLEVSDELLYPLQVFVEKSRVKQAEATIVQLGGKL